MIRFLFPSAKDVTPVYELSSAANVGVTVGNKEQTITKASNSDIIFLPCFIRNSPFYFGLAITYNVHICLNFILNYIISQIE